MKQKLEYQIDWSLAKPCPKINTSNSFLPPYLKCRGFFQCIHIKLTKKNAHINLVSYKQLLTSDCSKKKHQWKIYCTWLQFLREKHKTVTINHYWDCYYFFFELVSYTCTHGIWTLDLTLQQIITGERSALSYS